MPWPGRHMRGPAGVWLVNIALAAVYFGTAKLGLSLAFRTSSVTAVWPPTGIALVALFIGGMRLAPGVVLGALLANATTGGVPAGSVVLIALGNTLEAVAGAWLLERAGFRPSLERLRDVLALALAGGLSTTLAASVGTASLLAASNIDGSDFGAVWRTWWLGDLGGDLVVAPALFVAVGGARPRTLPGGWLEAATLATSLAVLSVVVFSISSPIFYLVFPGLAWGALRFWQPGAAVASLLVAGIAVALTANDHGPFMRADADASLLLAQTFVGFAGLTAYMLAAVATQRRRAEATLQHIAEALQESLLPPGLPAIPGIDLAVHFRPAGLGNQVGGDFYDVFDLGDDTWGIVIGDVCGKGPRAAGVTGLARHTLRAAAHFERTPSRLLGRLNTAVRDALAPEDFCTASYVSLELGQAGSARALVSIAGHPLPLVLRAGGDVEVVGNPGTLLGVLDRPHLADFELELRAGDALMLYTDGLTEAFAPGTVLEAEEVAAQLAACNGGASAEIVRTITTELLGDGSREPRDDIALVVLRIAPQASG